MDDVKKRLKILLRPGEPEKRPELTWPKSMKKEPVEVVKASANPCRDRAPPQLFRNLQEVIELLSSFRAIMRKNFETMDVDKIQERWYVRSPPMFQFDQTKPRLGAVVTSLGYSENAGRSYLKTFVMSNRKSLIRLV
jgi:hypothetical protein